MTKTPATVIPFAMKRIFEEIVNSIATFKTTKTILYAPRTKQPWPIPNRMTGQSDSFNCMLVNNVIGNLTICQKALYGKKKRQSCPCA
jgi:hypothetical protein